MIHSEHSPAVAPGLPVLRGLAECRTGIMEEGRQKNVCLTKFGSFHYVFAASFSQQVGEEFTFGPFQLKPVTSSSFFGSELGVLDLQNFQSVGEFLEERDWNR